MMMLTAELIFQILFSLLFIFTVLGMNSLTKLFVPTLHMREQCSGFPVY